jgi:glycosyltransferase involved in cell wall biosynthesis
MVYPRHSIRLTETVTPLKPLEAMALKRLVLASDIGGHRELIKDGQTGCLFEADNADKLAEVYDGLLKRRDEWPTMLEKGRHFVEDERSWENSVSHYRTVYGACLGKTIY